ncbi:MAG: hypothetical protein HN731_02560 [Rhodospirillaceae bacterium]|nr:hypothetical protein [Rhodospirillaceae bacterium]
MMQTKRFLSVSRFASVTAAMLIVLSACAYKGGSDHPVIRKFTWFSYIAGDDIRQACTAKSGERFRFVYNAVYNEQVRTYDITPADEGRYQVRIRVTNEADLTWLNLERDNPDFFKPWRPKISTTNIAAADVAILRRTLQNARFFDSRPPAENISSISFYWVISACIGGKFSQNAYVWPSESFKKAQFGKLLSAWDFTDIPVNPPRKTTNFSIYGTNDETQYNNLFNLQFGSDGLIRHYVLIN